MAQQTIWDKIREWIGGIAWDVFLWSARMTEDEYFNEVTRAAELQHAPVQTDQPCPYCYGYGTLRDEEAAADALCPACEGSGWATRSVGG